MFSLCQSVELLCFHQVSLRLRWWGYILCIYNLPSAKTEGLTEDAKGSFDKLKKNKTKKKTPPRYSFLKSSGSCCIRVQADIKCRDHTNRCQVAEWNQRRRASTRERRLVWDNLLRRPGRLLALAGNVPAPPPAFSPPGRAGMRAESQSAARSNEPVKRENKTAMQY